MDFDLNEANLLFAETVNASPHVERLMRTLCREIGPRPSASEGMKQAQVFLAEQWRELGAVGVHTEPVSMPAWDEGEATLEVIAPVRRTFDTLGCINSASGSVEAPLLDAGALTYDDLYALGEAAHGAGLLARGHMFGQQGAEPLQKKVSVAEAAGAAAVILTGSHPDQPAIYFINRSAVPVLNVSEQAGKELAELCRGGRARAKLQASGRARAARCANLVGQLGPDDADTDLIVTCAHLDSFFLAPGAVDDASGIVSITEIARALAPLAASFRRTLRLIAFTGEEYGYAGSKAYVREHAGELDRIRFVLSQDCLFDTTAKGMAVMWSPSMHEYITAAMAGLHPELDVRNFFCMSSDYLPVMLAGVPAGRPADWTKAAMADTHTRLDTDDRVDIPSLKANAVVFGRLLLKLLTDPKPLPAHRNSPDRVRELARRDGAAEQLRWQIALT